MLSKQKIRPALEIVVEFSAIFFYIWILELRAPPWVRSAFFWLICVGFPIACIVSERNGLPEFSLDWRCFLNCLRGIVWFTLFATIFLAGLALYYKALNYDGHFLSRMAEYFFWAFLQQIGLQTFLTRRVQQLIPHADYWTAGVSATIFALIHIPNPALFFLTWIGGFFWALSFQRSPNLYALAFSHGWLAVTALYCVPTAWIHTLKIGPAYWKF